MMNKNIQVLLATVDKVKSFVTLASKQTCDLDLVSGRHVIDAKSIMGVFSLDLSKPIDFVIHLDGEEKAKVEEAFADYIV